MSEMIERATKAAWDELKRQAEGDEVFVGNSGIVDGRPDMEALVKAILAEIREPTEAMIEAAEIAHSELSVSVSGDERLEMWRAMIDAALK